MKYESSQQTAIRPGLPAHTVRERDTQPEHGEKASANGERPVRVAMPLMNSAYPVGKCREFIEAIPDEDVRAIAWGEYYYYSGQAELAAETMKPYEGSADPALRYSANLV